MKIVLIGSGNIATFFGKKFQAAGFEIVQVVSYRLDHAKKLAQQYGCAFSNSVHQINRDADVYLFAVKDDVLIEMAKSLSIPNKLVVHTAGSIHLHEIQQISNKLACLWCVYSINKMALPQSNDIPLVVNCSADADNVVVKLLAQSISTKHYYLNDEQKSMLHLAAVFANNFTNYLYSISKQIVEKNEVPFEILYPIISNTADKVLVTAPEESQTGPAVRGDENTLKKHKDLLKNQPDFLHIYEMLSKSIAQSAKR